MSRNGSHNRPNACRISEELLYATQILHKPLIWCIQRLFTYTTHFGWVVWSISAPLSLLRSHKPLWPVCVIHLWLIYPYFARVCLLLALIWNKCWSFVIRGAYTSECHNTSLFCRLYMSDFLSYEHFCFQNDATHESLAIYERNVYVQPNYGSKEPVLYYTSQKRSF